MKIAALLTLITLNVAALGIGPAMAGQVGTLNIFQANTPAVAQDVNDNFTAVETAVNDNDDRIDANESNIVDINTELDSVPGVAFVKQASSASLTGSYSNIMSITVNVPSSGYVFTTATGMIQVSNKTSSSSSDYCSVYVGMSDASNTNPDTYTRFYISGIGPSGSFNIPYSVQHVYPVTTGSNTFYLVGIENGGSGSAGVWYSQITAIFIKNSL